MEGIWGIWVLWWSGTPQGAWERRSVLLLVLPTELLCVMSAHSSFHLNSSGRLEKQGAGKLQGGGGLVTGHMVPMAE